MATAQMKRFNTIIPVPAISAGGVASVIKMVMAMRHGMLPKTLHVDAPSANVDWSAGKVRLLTEPVPWPENGHPRRAGVSAFGISGTNAHVILEQPPADVAEPAAEAGGSTGDSRPAGGPAVLTPVVVSARSPQALRAQAARLLSRRPLSQPDGSGSAVTDLGYSLATTRAALPHRSVVVAADGEELLRGLRAVSSGQSAAGVFGGSAAGGRLALVADGVVKVVEIIDEVGQRLRGIGLSRVDGLAHPSAMISPIRLRQLCRRRINLSIESHLRMSTESLGPIGMAQGPPRAEPCNDSAGRG